MAEVGFELRFWSNVRGPISSGRIHQHVAEYEADVAEALDDAAKDAWLGNLHGSIRHQTPYYTTRIAKRRLAWNRYQVHDHGVIYGHWLEGTGSRNAPVTIFPGYFSKERAEATVRAKRSSIARRILRQHRARGRLI